MTPRFVHDCPHCLFMGRSGEYDTYYCARAGAPGGGSVIARYGNDAGEYASSPVSTALAITSSADQHPDAPFVAYVRLAKRLLHDGYITLTMNEQRVKEHRELWSDWHD